MWMPSQDLNLSESDSEEENVVKDTNEKGQGQGQGPGQGLEQGQVSVDSFAAALNALDQYKSNSTQKRIKKKSKKQNRVEKIEENKNQEDELSKMLTRRHSKTKVYSGTKSQPAAYGKACSKNKKKKNSSKRKKYSGWKIRCAKDFLVTKRRHGENWKDAYIRLQKEKNSLLQPLISDITERAESRKMNVKMAKVLHVLPGPSPKKKVNAAAAPAKVNVENRKIGSCEFGPKGNQFDPKPKPKSGPAPLMAKCIKAARAIHMCYRR